MGTRERAKAHCVVCGYETGTLIVHPHYVKEECEDGTFRYVLVKTWYHAPESSAGCWSVYQRDTEDETLFF